MLVDILEKFSHYRRKFSCILILYMKTSWSTWALSVKMDLSRSSWNLYLEVCFAGL